MMNRAKIKGNKGPLRIGSDAATLPPKNQLGDKRPKWTACSALRDLGVKI